MERFWLYLRISAQMTPISVTADNSHLLDLVANLKHGADALMAHVMQVQVRDAQRRAGIGEILAGGLLVKREDTPVALDLGLAQCQIP